MDNESLIKGLLRFHEEGFISDNVIEAMRMVDRRDFVPEQSKDYAYHDLALPIGYGQTISQPSVIGRMLTKLEVNSGDIVLEIGTGSGYQTAILCELVGPRGKVISVDRVYELIERAKFSLEKAGYSPILRLGDASCGWEEFKPYDGIVASAAYPGPEVPIEIKRQLKKDGVFVGPIGRIIQHLAIYQRDKDQIIWDIPVMFVPMIGKCGFKE